MFVFEDIVMLDDRSLQMVLREVDSKDLSLAMKGTSDEVAAKIYKNMSKRAATTLKEELEYMGPVRIRDVEESQQKVVNIIRKLEEKGDIVVSRGKGDEMIV
jgi:flagellar motor switch protein FliG